MKNIVKRAALSLGAAGLLGASLLTGGASAAEAQGGQFQFCVEGDYAASLEIHPTPIGEGMTTPGMSTTIIEPGNCTEDELFDTFGKDAPVDVWGTNPDGSTFHVGATTYNSDKGLGVTAEGTADEPTLAVW